jgi:uncharacterized protein (TIGR02996 family)
VTTDADALAAALVADPLDPAPRLILADCLDEQGRAEDAACLRRPGQLQWQDFSPWGPASFWWLSAGHSVAVMKSPARPGPCPCGGGFDMAHLFGRWWCWQCAAREAVRRIRGDNPPPFENLTSK